MTQKKEVGGLIVRHSISYAAGIVMGTLVAKYGISEDTLEVILHNIDSVISFIGLFIAASLSYLQKHKVNKKIKRLEQKAKFND